MKRITSLVLIAVICLGVYLVRPLDALTSQGPICFAFPQNTAETHAACEALLERDLDDSDRGLALFYIGLAHDIDEDNEAALAAYAKAEKLIKKRELHYNRGLLHFREKRYKTAIEEGEYVEAEWPKPRDLTWALNQEVLAFSYEKTGDTEAAIAAASASLTVQPDHAKLRKLRLRVLEKDGPLESHLTRLEDLTFLIARAEPGDTRLEMELDRLGVLGQLRLPRHLRKGWDDLKLRLPQDAQAAQLDTAIGHANKATVEALETRKAEVCGKADASDGEKRSCAITLYSLGEFEGAIAVAQTLQPGENADKLITRIQQVKQAIAGLGF